MEFTFKELLDRVNAVVREPWAETKLRYYLLKVLEEKKDTRGVVATYPAATLGKLVFLATLLEREPKPPLRVAVNLLAELPDEVLHRIGMGEESVEFGYADFDAYEPPIFRTESGRSAPRDDHPFGHVLPMQSAEFTPRSPEPTADSAARYADRAFASYLGSLRSASAPRSGDDWKHERFGPDLQVRYRSRRPLTPAQEKQLRMAGELIRAILDQEQ